MAVAKSRSLCRGRPEKWQPPILAEKAGYLKIGESARPHTQYNEWPSFFQSLMKKWILTLLALMRAAVKSFRSP
jgi:hypothetical protein